MRSECIFCHKILTTKDGLYICIECYKKRIIKNDSIDSKIMNDSYKKSHEEQIVNQVAGYLVGVALNYLIFPLLGIPFGNHIEYWGVSLLYVAAAYVRGIIFRRWYDKLPYNGSLFKRLRTKIQA